MKTKKFLAFVLVIAMVLGSVSVVFGASGTKKGTATAITLEKYSGSVTITNASGKEVKPREGAKLYSGYTIKTGKKSSANLLLDDKSALLIESSSKVQLNKSGKKIAVMLMSGTVLDVSEKLAKDQTLDIYTTNMVTGVRGTVPEVSHDSANDKSSSTTLQGTTEATEKTGGYTLKSTKLPAGYGASTTTEQVAVNRAENTGNRFVDVQQLPSQQEQFAAERKTIEALQTETKKYTEVDRALQGNPVHQQGYEQAFFPGPRTPQDMESFTSMIMQEYAAKNQAQDQQDTLIKQAVQDETPATQGEKTDKVFEKEETLPAATTTTVTPVTELPQSGTQTPATPATTGGGGSDSGSSTVKATIGLPTKVGDYNSPFTVYEGIRTASNLGDYDPIGLAGSTNDYMFYTSDASQFSVVFTDYLGLAGDVKFTLSQAGRTLPITSTSAGIFVSEASGSQRVWIATFNNPSNTGVITVDCTVTKSEGWTISVPKKLVGESESQKDLNDVILLFGSDVDLSEIDLSESHTPSATPLTYNDTDTARVYTVTDSSVNVFIPAHFDTEEYTYSFSLTDVQVAVSGVETKKRTIKSSEPEVSVEYESIPIYYYATITNSGQSIDLQCNASATIDSTSVDGKIDTYTEAFLFDNGLFKSEDLYYSLGMPIVFPSTYDSNKIHVYPSSRIEFVDYTELSGTSTYANYHDVKVSGNEKEEFIIVSSDDIIEPTFNSVYFEADEARTSEPSGTYEAVGWYYKEYKDNDHFQEKPLLDATITTGLVLSYEKYRLSGSTGSAFSIEELSTKGYVWEKTPAGESSEATLNLSFTDLDKNDLKQTTTTGITIDGFKQGNEYTFSLINVDIPYPVCDQVYFTKNEQSTMQTDWYSFAGWFYLNNAGDAPGERFTNEYGTPEKSPLTPATNDPIQLVAAFKRTGDQSLFTVTQLLSNGTVTESDPIGGLVISVPRTDSNFATVTVYRYTSDNDQVTALSNSKYNETTQMDEYTTGSGMFAFSFNATKDLSIGSSLQFHRYAENTYDDFFLAPATEAAPLVFATVNNSTKKATDNCEKDFTLTCNVEAYIYDNSEQVLANAQYLLTDKLFDTANVYCDVENVNDIKQTGTNVVYIQVPSYNVEKHTIDTFATVVVVKNKLLKIKNPALISFEATSETTMSASFLGWAIAKGPEAEYSSDDIIDTSKPISIDSDKQMVAVYSYTIKSDQSGKEYYGTIDTFSDCSITDTSN